MPGLAEPTRHWEIFDEHMGYPPDWDGCTTEMYKDYLVKCHGVGHLADREVTILSSALILWPPAGGERYLGAVERRPGGGLERRAGRFDPWDGRELHVV